MRVYVRKGYHLIHKELLRTLDIANIQQHVEYQGKGNFRRFMQHVESYQVPVYVECIVNPRLVDMLERNGYSIIGSSIETNAIKFCNHIQHRENDEL